jgi:membrane protease YdiL (CAAX protease family)
MKKLIPDKYIIIYLIIYSISVTLMIIMVHYPAGELISIFILLGPILTSMAYFISRTSSPLFSDRNGQAKESMVILALIIYIMIVITWRKDITSLFFQDRILENERLESFITLIFKLLAFVVIPLILYFVLYRFTLKDWGINLPIKAYFTRKSITIFFIMTFMLFLVQFYMGNGAKPIREGLLTQKQLLFGLPLFYIWLIFEVGIVEEFFFRNLLQSRISVILNSQTGGIVISALVFGLAHAPGIFLREGGVLANLGEEPSLWLSIGYSISVLSIAGLFLAVIWAKTRNFWLIVGIHAFVDTLPGLKDFIELWGIR